MAEGGPKAGRLSQLDLKRDCSASGAKDSCWLCDELDNWNNVLNDLHLSLVEYQPGKLRLCAQTRKPPVDVADEDALYDTSCFTAWLIRKHGCIESVSIKQGDPHWQVAGLHDSVFSASSNLRDISIEGNGPLDWDLVLDSLGQVAQLESLKLTDVMINDKLLAKLVQLLTANACFVKTVVLTRTSLWGDVCDGFARSISRCDNLRVLVLDVSLVMPGTTSPEEMGNARERSRSPDSSDEDSSNEDGLSYSSIMKSLLDDLDTADFLNCVFPLQPTAVHLNLKERNDMMLHELSDFLGSSVALTSLSLNAFHQNHLEIIEYSLITNGVLSELVISYRGRRYPQRTSSCVGDVLQSLLSRNKGLRSLTIENCPISDQGGRQISEGLKANSTLEQLSVNSTIPIFVALPLALCGALVTNKTLRTLRFGGSIIATDAQRMQLSRNLAMGGLFGRVQLEWTHWDSKLLARCLLTPSQCPTELRLEMRGLCDAPFAILCRALSASLCLESLTVYSASNASDTHAAILRKVLERNKSLKCVAVHDQSSVPRLAMEALQGLASNSCVTELALHCCRLDMTCTELFASLLASNEALSKVVLSCSYPLTTQCANVLYEGLVQNCSITEWRVNRAIPLMENMERAVQRNLSRLQRAVRFVLQPVTVKLCAEAFERLVSKTSLISGLISASAISQAEAESAVKAARKFIQDNYLFINQIVCNGINCCAGEGTQIDKLNVDCWRAITKYLKVSDVISP